MIKIKLSKDYSIFVTIIVVITMILVGVFTYFSIKESSIENLRILQKNAKNIDLSITESFDYVNQITNHIGRQIVDHGHKDLKYIAKLLKESDKISHQNPLLFSWTSFDWINSNNIQVVNSNLGIRKNPPDMSSREYISLSRQNPWVLQTSGPVIGNPSKAWVIPAATGITSNEGKYLGAITLGFNIKDLQAQITEKLNEGLSFVILDDKMHLVANSIDVKIECGNKFFEKNYDVKLFLQDEGVLVKAIEYNDIKFNYYIKISKYPYIVLVGFNESFLNRQFTISILPRILEIILLAIFLLVIFYFFAIRSSLLEREKSLRLSLERANKAKDKMLSSIAHDVKNQIFGINGLSKIILDNKSADQIAKDQDLQIVEIIADQAEEMMYLVKDLLKDNQSDDGEFNLVKVEKCQIKNLVRGLILLNNNLATANQVQISLEITDDIPDLYCDVRRMRQVLMNLLNNAIKYSRPNTEVKISAKYLKKDDRILIEVSDQGYGMSKEDIKKYLAGKGGEIDKSEISKIKNLESHGIGVAIVLRLVELHGGEVEIESKKNHGTKVKLYFSPNKLRVGKNSKMISKAEKKVLPNHKSKSILLVDDNPVNIKIGTKILESNGYNVFCAENGKEALRILDEKNFDLILMDGEMPIMNGYEAAKAIRGAAIFKNFKRGKIIPIIALMSSSDNKTIERAKKSGMNDHVEKAISKTKLLSVIEKYLG